MSSPMVSVAGIRGIVGDSLRPEEFLKYVLAFATLMKGGKIVLGGDTRVSRDMMRHLAFAGLLSSGCQVIDLGLVPTPTVGLMVRKLKAAGGIAITASHNPVQWNAFKFFGSHGSFLNSEDNAVMQQIISTESYIRKPYDQLGKVISEASAIETHLSQIYPCIDVEAIRQKQFKVVVDCVNGVGGLIAKPLLETLNCKVEFLYTDVDALFPRDPEPLPENLTELGAKVKSMGADIGFAIDPDADRLAIVNEAGKPIGEERTLALCTAHVLQKTQDDSEKVVVANLSTSQSLDRVVEKFGGILKRTPIGEAHVVGEITRSNAVIGGEGNGGIIFPQVHPGRDSATGIALILDYLAASGKTISELNSEIPVYEMVKIKLPVRAERSEIIKILEAEYTDCERNLNDGFKAIYPDCWVHVRPSGTEPVVRIFAEAETEAEALSLVERAKNVLNSLATAG